MIGISFEIPYSAGNPILQILKNIDVSKFHWLLDGAEIEADYVTDATKGRFFPENIMDGNTFMNCFKRGDYFIVYLSVWAFMDKEKIRDLFTMEQYYQSNCQLMLLIDDTSYVNIYCKDEEILKSIIKNALEARYQNIEVLNQDNDNRKTPRVGTVL